MTSRRNVDGKEKLPKRALELKERTEEDCYFAERDRVLIARLTQAYESEQERTIRQLARSRCPQLPSGSQYQTSHNGLIFAHPLGISCDPPLLEAFGG
ncbi:MAG TPA: hypothetical protein VGX03_00655 [Candidatus Binatia bacterium]|jgi:hypothetical protein|nr:hypothetical protein [Candidatus Binatia bacterium]